MPSVTSTLLHRGPVHLRVRLHRGHELGDPTGRLLDLARAASPRRTVLATHSRPGSRAGPVEHGRGPLAPGEVDAGGRQRRRDDPVAPDAVAAQPRRQGLLAVGHGQAGRARPARGSISRRSASSAVNWSAEISPWASRPSEASSVVQLARQGVDRAGGGRRRVVDLVRQPGRERAERDQRLALARTGLDVARGVEQPVDEVRDERDTPSSRSRSAAAGHAEHPTRTGRVPTGREVDAVRRPTHGSRRPSGRARRPCRRPVSSRPT